MFSLGIVSSAVAKPVITAISINGFNVNWTDIYGTNGVNRFNQTSNSWGIDPILYQTTSSNASINITVTGTGLSYTWQYSGRKLWYGQGTTPSYSPGYAVYPLTLSNNNYSVSPYAGYYNYWNDGTSYVGINGASTNALSISNVPSSDNISWGAGYFYNTPVHGQGWYRCIISNSGGTVYTPWIPIGRESAPFSCNPYYTCDPYGYTCNSCPHGEYYPETDTWEYYDADCNACGRECIYPSIETGPYYETCIYRYRPYWNADY